MFKNDVNYPFVKEQADIVAVLAFYNINLLGEGEQRRGLCPFHDDEKPSLSVNVVKNQWRCHGCGAKGNIIDLVQELDEELQNPRKAAQQIAHISGIPGKPKSKFVPPLQSKQKQPKPKAAAAEPAQEIATATAADTEPAEDIDGIEINKPLTFELQLAPVVPGEETVLNEFVESHGLPYERIADLGIGLAQRASMQNRLAIPILNASDKLVAYSGRDVGLLDDPDEPKYKFPKNFRKELEIYGWNVAQHFERVVLVESFLSVIKHGGEASKYGDTGFGVAALMGTSISDQQIRLLTQSCSRVIVCFDGDEAGLTAAPKVAGRIAASGMWVQVHNYADGKKPHHDDIDAFCTRYG